jgi:hypothetical protein
VAQSPPQTGREGAGNVNETDPHRTKRERAQFGGRIPHCAVYFELAGAVKG